MTTGVQQAKKGESRASSSSIEIERKFTVNKLPENLHQDGAKEIFQGYLVVTRDGTEVRIRKRGRKCSLTIKHGSGKTRIEEEIGISERQFSSLWALTGRRRVKKLRYRIPEDGLTVELDVYQGKLEGLITAEVQFESEEDSNAFRPPAWLGAEITDDERYKNRNLALRGIPKAKDS